MDIVLPPGGNNTRHLKDRNGHSFRLYVAPSSPSSFLEDYGLPGCYACAYTQKFFAAPYRDLLEDCFHVFISRIYLVVISNRSLDNIRIFVSPRVEWVIGYEMSEVFRIFFKSKYIEMY